MGVSDVEHRIFTSSIRWDNTNMEPTIQVSTDVEANDSVRPRQSSHLAETMLLGESDKASVNHELAPCYELLYPKATRGFSSTLSLGLTSVVTDQTQEVPLGPKLMGA